MQISLTGIILNTEKFDECVAFYRGLFDLPVMFHETNGDFRLTCLEFGGSYLMIETGGIAKNGGKSISENSTKLRFNVADIDAAMAKVTAFGIEAIVQKPDWGSTINLHDPDGNRIGIRDEPAFVRQFKS